MSEVTGPTPSSALKSHVVESNRAGLKPLCKHPIIECVYVDIVRVSQCASWDPITQEAFGPNAKSSNLKACLGFPRGICRGSSSQVEGLRECNSKIGLFEVNKKRLKSVVNRHNQYYCGKTVDLGKSWFYFERITLTLPIFHPKYYPDMTSAV
ncbi:hypothetical protein ACTXT7_005174 [Hymenolepis weldensis]